MRGGGANLVSKTYVHVVAFSWAIFALQWCWSNWQTHRLSAAYEEPQVTSLLTFLSDCPSRNSHRAGSTSQAPYVKALKTESRSNWRDSLPLNLNEIDSANLERLPWIGPITAGRICRFRNALGGFHSVAQLSEVWGMSPEQIHVITPWFHTGKGPFRFVCVDTASWATMKAHPYIRSSGARYIEKYRIQHELLSIQDLKNAIPVNDSLFRRWLPYLRVCNGVQEE